MVQIQTEIMINMHDDLNIGFTELYKKLRNIEDPVIVKQENEEEGEHIETEKRVEDTEVEEITSNQ